VLIGFHERKMYTKRSRGEISCGKNLTLELLKKRKTGRNNELDSDATIDAAVQ
jgi:hypothetical protein